MTDEQLKQLYAEIFETKESEKKKLAMLNVSRFGYYTDYLVRLLKAQFEDEVEDYWDDEFMLNTLIFDGVFVVFDYKNSKPLMMNCQPYGVNMYYKPTNVNVANPVLGTLDLTIGKDCEIVYLEEAPRNMPVDYPSPMSIVHFYARKLVNIDQCIDASLNNSMVTAIFQAPNKKSAESFKQMHKDIRSGAPAVFIDDSLDLSLGKNLLYTPAKDNFICDIAQIEKRKVIEEFLTAIGINNANTDKRERLNQDEVNANNDECVSGVEVWRRNLRTCTSRVKKMFPDLKFSLTIPEKSIIDTSPRNSTGEAREESKDKKMKGGWKK
ncbi:MAG: hypothetical protein IIW93_05510 [Bacteroidaceae bacterium]|nr:hypothetical protein [Bacteroidaceae bacterium]